MFSTGDARRSKQYIVNSQQNTVQPPRPTTTARPKPPPSTTAYTTTTTIRPTFEQTTARIVPSTYNPTVKPNNNFNVNAVSTYRPTQQPRINFNDNTVSTYRPAHNLFSNARTSARNGKEIHLN
jgi:hypothetical protein